MLKLLLTAYVIYTVVIVPHECLNIIIYNDVLRHLCVSYIAKMAVVESGKSRLHNYSNVYINV